MIVSSNDLNFKSSIHDRTKDGDRFADTGCSYHQPYPIREACFRSGFLSEVLACWEDALRTHTVKIFRGRLAAKTEQNEAFRSATNCRTDRAAWRRGKRIKHSYVESDQNQRRWVRGRHHGSHSVKHGLKILLDRSPAATMDDVRESLAVYVDAVSRWAATTPPDAPFGKCEPPFWQDTIIGTEKGVTE